MVSRLYGGGVMAMSENTGLFYELTDETIEVLSLIHI